MKKQTPLHSYLFFTLLFIFLFSSCGVKQEEVKVDLSPMTRFRIALAGLHPTDQKAIFNGLDPALRFALWEDRLLQAAEACSDEAQKEVVTNILEQLSVELYTEGDTLLHMNFMDFMTEIEGHALQVFNYDTLKFNQLLTVLGQTSGTAGVVPLLPLPDCDCNRSFNGFVNGNDCGVISRACWQTPPCNPTNWGCGHAWLWGCDGMCN